MQGRFHLTAVVSSLYVGVAALGPRGQRLGAAGRVRCAAEVRGPALEPHAAFTQASRARHRLLRCVDSSAFTQVGARPTVIGRHLASHRTVDAAQESTNVGTKLLFENDRVRVWEMRLKPGESSERHTHRNDYLFVYLAPAQLTLFPDDGAPETSQAHPGGVEYSEVGQGIRHRVQNTGDSEHWEILVELKGKSRSPVPRAPESNE